MKFLKKFWPHLLVIFIIFISYGLTLKMYFWQDDSALIFKLQNQEPASGSFGVGIVGDGPYKYLVTPFVPFFPIFGINPFGYFLGGFITYILATWAFYFFAKRLFERKNVAYIATLIFAGGYVGSDIMFRVINSWQTNIGLIFAFLTLERLVTFLKTKSITSYITGVILYLACTEFVFIRSHSLILPIFFLFLLFRFIPFSIKSLFSFIILQIPFWIIFKVKYLSDSGFGGPGISSLIKEMLDGKIEKISALIANTGNAFVSNVIQSKFISFVTKQFLQGQDIESQIFTLNIIVLLLFVALAFFIKNKFKISTLILFLGLLFNLYLYKKAAFWYMDAQSVVSGLIGIEIILLTIFWSFNIWKKNKETAIYLLFGLVFIVSQIFGYFIQYQTAIFSTTHRYFSYSLIGYAIFFAAIYLLAKKAKRGKLGYLIIGLILIPNLLLGFVYQSRLVKNRSLPTEKFYQDLRKYVPTVSKGDVFFFDVSQADGIPSLFGDFFSVGSMPETTALAIYYQVDRYDIQMITEYDELISKLVSGEVKVDQIHTFFYGMDGLIDTTGQTKKSLQNVSSLQNVDVSNPIYPSSVAMEIVFDAKITRPESPTKFTPNNLTFDQKKKIIEYLVAKENYYKNVKVTSSSDWKFREINYISDNDPSTTWQGHRIYWGEKRNEAVYLDLGGIKNINRLIWQNWKVSLSPLNYNIETSVDGINWTKVKEVVNNKEKKDGEVVIDEFNSTNARFVRMVITKTVTDDSPAILEIEAVESKFADLNISQIQSFVGDPVSLASNSNEWNILWDLFRPLIKIQLTWQTDKKERYDNTRLMQAYIGNFAYLTTIRAGGTNLERLSFKTNVLTDLEITTIKVKSLTLPEMKEKGLVKKFEEN